MDHDELLTSENTIPSSSSPAVFSDEPQRAFSPPSSPPGFPWEKDATNKPLQKPAKSAFSVLGKRKALGAISDNARPAKRTAIQPTSKASKSLMQMQISLGQEVQKRCKTCGMEYVPSSTEDTKLHDKYHKQCTEGYDVGKDFVQKIHKARKFATFKRAPSGDTICPMDCHDKPAMKKKAQAVLDVVQRELGAVEIPEKDIWDLRKALLSGTGESRFRAYMYIRGSRCIGFLLVEIIKEAYRVVEPTLPADHSAETESSEKKSTSGASAALKARQQAEMERLQLLEKQPMQLSKDIFPAHLGICRIWTSPTLRHQNIATTLLDTAFSDHNQRVDRGKAAHLQPKEGTAARGVSPAPQTQLDALMPTMERLESKDLVAFSQPTDAGRRLARRWFGRKFEWGVYVD